MAQKQGKISPSSFLPLDGEVLFVVARKAVRALPVGHEKHHVGLPRMGRRIERGCSRVARWGPAAGPHADRYLGDSTCRSCRSAGGFHPPSAYSTVAQDPDTSAFSDGYKTPGNERSLLATRASRSTMDASVTSCP